MELLKCFSAMILSQVLICCGCKACLHWGEESSSFTECVFTVSLNALKRTCHSVVAAVRCEQVTFRYVGKDWKEEFSAHLIRMVLNVLSV